jgi:glycosyltransferase involved in cell wall biosynthesis
LKVLYVQPGPGMGGSKISLYHMLKCAPGSQQNYLVLALPVQKEYEALVSPYVEKIYYQEIPTWQKYHRHTLAEKLRAPLGNAYRIFRSIQAALKLSKIIMEENIDLVHTNNSITPVGALAAWMTKTLHVWHIREPFGSKNQYRPILGDAISFCMIMKLSNVIICNSKYTAEPFSDRGIPHVVVLNGLDLTRFINGGINQRELRSKYAINEEEILIGMVGNLTTEWKRHDIFLNVAAILSKEFKKLRFIVFGASTDLDQTEYSKKLRDLSIDLGINEKVFWAEFVNDTSTMMNCMNIVIHPAVNEGSGRVVMEAMAAGKPVLAMRSGGVQELIEDGKSGFLVEPGNISELAGKVKILLADERMQRDIGKKAKEYAHAHFSDQASMNSIVKIYREIVRS